MHVSARRRETSLSVLYEPGDKLSDRAVQQGTRENDRGVEDRCLDKKCLHHAALCRYSGPRLRVQEGVDFLGPGDSVQVRVVVSRP